jgi:hypothetical protein
MCSSNRIFHPTIEARILLRQNKTGLVWIYILYWNNVGNYRSISGFKDVITRRPCLYSSSQNVIDLATHSSSVPVEIFLYSEGRPELVYTYRQLTKHIAREEASIFIYLREHSRHVSALVLRPIMPCLNHRTKIPLLRWQPYSRNCRRLWLQ